MIHFWRMRKRKGKFLEFYKAGPTFYIFGHAQMGCRNEIHKRGAETWSSNKVIRFILLNLDACEADDMLIEKRWKKIAEVLMEVQINQNLLSSWPPLKPPNSTLHARAVGHSQLSHNGWWCLPAIEKTWGNVSFQCTIPIFKFQPWGQGWFLGEMYC